MAIGKILKLSDKIYTGGNIWGWFWKKSKKRKKCFQKKPILYCWWLKKYFFSKTKGEIDYGKRYKTISMPFSWYYIFFELIQRDFGLHLPIIRIRIIKTKNSALKSDNAPSFYFLFFAIFFPFLFATVVFFHYFVVLAHFQQTTQKIFSLCTGRNSFVSFGINQYR